MGWCWGGLVRERSDELVVARRASNAALWESIKSGAQNLEKGLWRGRAEGRRYVPEAGAGVGLLWSRFPACSCRLARDGPGATCAARGGNAHVSGMGEGDRPRVKRALPQLLCLLPR